MEAALKDLADLGAELVDLDEVMSNENFWNDEYNVLLYEFKDGINIF